MTESMVLEATEAASAAGGFAALGLNDSLLSTLRQLKFHTPSDIQRELIPHALRGEDCLGQAKTGTGKTAAFSLPMLQMIVPGGGLQALVLVPTRELAKQVDEHVRKLGAAHPVRTVLVYGGKRVTGNLTALKKGCEILIGTPGRIQDLMARRAVDFSTIRLAVLDEVDRMLDIGFREDIRRILRSIKQRHQTIFVSATIDPEIRKLAKSYMHDPVEINVSSDKLTVEDVEIDYVTVEREDKYPTLLGFLKTENPKLAIVFTNMKSTARRIAERLRKNGVNCKEIHGDLMQARREKVLESFRKQHIQVLVATDLASRGLDVMEVSHIVNYDVPEDAAAFVHRVGRTARMGQSGYTVTFVTREEGKLLTEIEKLINRELICLDPPWLVKTHARPEGAAGGEPRPDGQPGAADDAATPQQSRFQELMRRDSHLDSLGIAPVQRTLGSRFKSTRRRGR